MDCKPVNNFYFNKTHLKNLSIHGSGFTPWIEYLIVTANSYKLHNRIAPTHAKKNSNTVIKTCERTIIEY